MECGQWNHSRIMYRTTAECYVALELLSVNCSEASVERSFSAQSATHSKNRNRSLDERMSRMRCS